MFLREGWLYINIYDENVSQGGVILVSAEHAESFLARYTREAEKNNYKLLAVQLGSLDQLKNLVHLVSTNEVSPWLLVIFDF